MIFNAHENQYYKIKIFLLATIAAVMGMSVVSCEPSEDLYGCPEVEYHDSSAVDLD